MTYIFDIPQVRKSQALLDFVVNVTYLVSVLGCTCLIHVLLWLPLFSY